MAKYTMIVTEEDERYANKEKGLSFFAENPWEGCLNSIVYGDTADELITEAAKTEGLFYQLLFLISAKISTILILISCSQIDKNGIESGIIPKGGFIWY